MVNPSADSVVVGKILPLLLYNNGVPKPVYYIWRDFGPSMCLPAVYNGYSQTSSMSGVPTGEPAKSGDPYPPPLENSSATGTPAGRYDEPNNPYPSP